MNAFAHTPNLAPDYSANDRSDEELLLDNRRLATRETYPNRRTVLAGITLATVSLALPSAASAASEFCVPGPDPKDECDWLDPRAAIERLRDVFGRTSCQPDMYGNRPCERFPAYPCDWFCSVALDGLGTGYLLEKADGEWLSLYSPYIRIAPAMIDVLAREEWVSRLDMWGPGWSGLPIEANHTGALAARALAGAVKFASWTNYTYVQHGCLDMGHSPAIMRHPGLRAIRHAAPSPSRHHVPIDVVHELPAERATVTGRAKVRTRLVLGPGAVQ